ncbi:MAG: peptidylprolyl isomerase [Halioglobus sp.]
MNVKWIVFLGLLVMVSSSIVRAQNIVEDEGAGLTLEELDYIVAKWPPQMQKAAANDLGDRLELVSKAIATSKLAQEFDQMTFENDGEAYLDGLFIIRDAKRRFMIDQYLKQLEVPDVTPLAKERYLADKEIYAGVEEQRLSSHILFRCAPPTCNADEKRVEVDEILASLEAGASFEDMVQKYSDDSGTKVNNGRFDHWVARDDKAVAQQYVMALHRVESVGGYTPVVITQFGYHIIRLDEIKESHYRPFEEVQPTMEAELVKEFKKRSLIAYVNSYGITDKVFINGQAMEQIFDKYKATGVAP